ncbi:hypothetical protein Ddye_014749 [Dipteronia dyeriana]|uniref:Transcription repressor n=1 Tax=Dipteronia dyeriana TaxID=168575 RepID=A0AAD9X9F1_9ROSI|nr:hypothetical protein Ddye_014749 [Dipteronia dyeriana]
MPKQLQKSLQVCLSKKSLQECISKIKTNNQLNSSKNWILSNCKHPKTLSFDVNNNGNKDHSNDDNSNGAATLVDIDRFLQENFKSLYLEDEEDNKKEREEKERGGNRDKSPRGVLFGSPRFDEPPSDLHGSHRFFVSPSRSGSLIEDVRLSLTTSSDEDVGFTSMSTSTTNKTLNRESSTSSDDSKDSNLPKDCIAILTYSPKPYDDFRGSMQEMVESRLQDHPKVDWEFLEELLFYYLNLNDKKSHKFILRAFVDLVVELRQNPIKNPARSRKFRIASSERRRRTRHVT